MSSSELSHDDMYVIADAAMDNKDYGLAAQWYTKAAESRDPNFPKAEAYVKLARANKQVKVTCEVFKNAYCLYLL